MVMQEELEVVHEELLSLIAKTDELFQGKQEEVDIKICLLKTFKS